MKALNHFTEIRQDQSDPVIRVLLQRKSSQMQNIDINNSNNINVVQLGTLRGHD